MEGACVGGCEPVEAPRPHGVGGRGVAAAAVFDERGRSEVVAVRVDVATDEVEDAVVVVGHEDLDASGGLLLLLLPTQANT